MSIASGYVLHLYCDNDAAHPNGYLTEDSFNSFPVEIVTDGPKCYTQARKTARKMGWIFHKNGRTTCPYCNRPPKLTRKQIR